MTRGYHICVLWVGFSPDGFAANLIIADGSIRAKLTGKLGHWPQV